jgi:hypothetical protein
MAQPWRLPEVNGDDGAWGDILNQFLNKEHFNFDNSGAGRADSGGHMNITIRAGSTVAGTQPITFTSGPLLTVPAPGALEFLTDRLYFTSTTGPTRQAVATYADATGGATGDIYFRDASGNFARLAAASGSGYVLTSSPATPPSWAPQVVPGLSQQQVMAISSMRM